MYSLLFARPNVYYRRGLSDRQRIAFLLCKLFLHNLHCMCVVDANVFTIKCWFQLILHILHDIRSGFK